MEHLVQWRCLPTEKATWENAQMLQQQFPTVDLEDKNPLDGERIDRPLRRSTRRGRKNPKYCGEEWLVIEHESTYGRCGLQETKSLGDFLIISNKLLC